jgi:hypothetical protein
VFKQYELTVSCNFVGQEGLVLNNKISKAGLSVALHPHYSFPFICTSQARNLSTSIHKRPKICQGVSL